MSENLPPCRCHEATVPPSSPCGHFTNCPYYHTLTAANATPYMVPSPEFAVLRVEIDCLDARIQALENPQPGPDDPSMGDEPTQPDGQTERDLRAAYIIGFGAGYDTCPNGMPGSAEASWDANKHYFFDPLKP